MRLRIAVCDDNKVVLEDEAKLIAKVLNKKNINNIVKCFENPESLLSSSMIYDIVFLDVEIGILNGIKTAEELKRKNKDCLVIFITNHWEYLDNAFDVHAFRYWKKPIEEEKLSIGIDAAVRELEAVKRTITVNAGNGNVEIYVKDIVYIYVSNKISRIVSTKGEIYTYDTYKSICERLSVLGCFGEPYRGYYVNFTYVQNYTQDKLICSYKDQICELNVSRRKYMEFNKIFNTWLGGKR